MANKSTCKCVEEFVMYAQVYAHTCSNTHTDKSTEKDFGMNFCMITCSIPRVCERRAFTSTHACEHIRVCRRRHLRTSAEKSLCRDSRSGEMDALSADEPPATMTSRMPTFLGSCVVTQTRVRWRVGCGERLRHA